MNRRKFVSSSASATLAGGMAAHGAAAPAGGPAIFELRYFRLRNSGDQVRKTNDFLGKAFLPAAQRIGLGPMGFFAAVIGEQSPFALALISYPSLDAVVQSMDKMASDKEFQKGFDEFNAMAEPSYMRIENSLLRGFASWPQIVPPSMEGRSGPRIFELRTYESNNLRAGKRKIRMFEEGEAGIFKRLGMNPVFFGETIVGRNLPNLTYMLAFDNLAARETLWSKFSADPEWQKMRSGADVSDALVVSNISNSILRPLPFSPIR